MNEKMDFRNANEEVYCTVEFDSDARWVFDFWQGLFGTQENFKRPVLYWKELVVKHNTPRGLTDVSRMVGGYDSSKEWMQKEIMPLVIKAGLRYHAMVIPKNIFAKLSTNDYKMAVKDYEVQLFDDIDKAKAWLKST